MGHVCHFNEIYHNEGATCILCSRHRTDVNFVQGLPESEEDFFPHEQLSEICEKLGFTARIKEIGACYSKLRRCNQNHQLNTTLLTSFFFIINQSHYLPVERLLRYSEVFGDGDSCKLFKKIQNIILRSNLSFPRPTIKSGVVYACNQMEIKPKYCNKILQIAISIQGEYLSHGKCSPAINTIIVTALNIFSADFKMIYIYDPCNILFVSPLSHKRMLNQLKRWSFTQ